jgi:hypothetical protein
MHRKSKQVELHDLRILSFHLRISPVYSRVYEKRRTSKETRPKISRKNG